MYACPQTSSSTTDAGQEIIGGEFTTLSFNVAGLPQSVSQVTPRDDIPRISPLLNNDDIVCVQEDFFYSRQLRRDISLPYQSNPSPWIIGIGDGLNRFSTFPFQEEVQRYDWTDCHGELDFGSDCLTLKGYSLARHEIGPNIFLDVYNLHMDAGSEPNDGNARGHQVEQLVDTILDESEGNAVIVVGDFNLRTDSRAGDAAIYQYLLEETNLNDVCGYVDCEDPYRIDKFLYRHSESTLLAPQYLKVADEFVDESGRYLSDHEAIRVLWKFVAVQDEE